MHTAPHQTTLRRLRLAAGLSIGALARKAGLPEVTVAALDRGRTGQPTARTAAALMRALDCSLEELLGTEPEPQKAG